MSATRMQQPLLGIQAARGVAALAVVLYHAGRMVALPQYVGYLPLGGAFNFGHAGVDFFFVLSGFIIHHVHHADVGRPASLGRYAGRRISRIYPPYWVATLLVLALALIGRGTAGLPDVRHLLGSLLLVPHAQEPILGVAWTLEREAIFYAVFALAICSRTLGVLVFGLWLGLWTLLVTTGRGLLVTEFDVLFFFGMAASWVVRHRTVRAPGVLLGVGIAAFAAAALAEAAGVMPVQGVAGRLAWGAASTLVVVGLASAERDGRLRMPPAAVLMGAASYSLYIVHTITIGLTARSLMAVGLGSHLPGWMVMLTTVAVSIAAGLAFHWMVERPATVRAQRLVARVGLAA